MATSSFEWPEACADSPYEKHEKMRFLLFDECVYCGIVEYV